MNVSKSKFKATDTQLYSVTYNKHRIKMSLQLFFLVQELQKKIKGIGGNLYFSTWSAKVTKKLLNVTFLNKL